MTARRLQGRDGFSLVDVLVALAVAGLVVTAGATLTSMIQHVESRARAANTARENVVAADRLLRAIVDGAVPDLSEDLERPEVWTSERATFMTVGPQMLAFDRPRPMTLSVEKGGGGARLLVRWRDPESGRQREEEVVSGAKALGLSYFGSERGGTGVWRPLWPQGTRLPLGVLLRIDMPELGSSIDIVVRTYSRMPEACAMLPHEPRCQDERPVARTVQE
ncbi:MAG: hypothetical protein DI565_17020 [Ancylobacter novellus]|uniref:Prepilin-type N-terminal cleavage/methylation domain-containing protein n=1 Tax=Ancylobacter novellus TaxID=921 RepID=A0A2W5K8M1_ANCNO|nr:MAG: hypothetical protein DI565_17020 [Ancylobacter novellus]